jgi:Flp pilus assembly protein TadG
MSSAVALPRRRGAALRSAFDHAFGRFAGDRRGISAVEFAIVLPFMVALYAGSIEFGEGLSTEYKATLAARTVADIASQYTSIDAPTMTSILGAASIVMAPYPANNMTVIVSEVTTDAKDNGTVTWSAAQNGSARTVGQAATLPADLRIPSVSLLWGEVNTRTRLASVISRPARSSCMKASIYIRGYQTACRLAAPADTPPLLFGGAPSFAGAS